MELDADLLDLLKDIQAPKGVEASLVNSGLVSFSAIWSLYGGEYCLIPVLILNLLAFPSA